MISKELSKHILTIGPNYNPPRGGIAQVLYTYDKDIFENFLFVKTTESGNSAKKYICCCIAIVKFLGYCLCKNIKIVHIHTASKNSFWRKSVFILLSWLLKKKVVLHIHGGQFEVFVNHHPFILHFLKRCSRIIVLSPSKLVYYQEHFGLNNVTVINNVIPRPIIKEKNNIDTVNFLFLGFLCKDKGIYDLLDIISCDKDRYTGKMKLFIGGNGNVEKVKRIIKENKLAQIVFYVGWVDGEKKIELLNKSHVYILPSYVEALPISILEAMSYHLPVISTQVGAIPNIVFNNENGLLINPRDKDALKNAISEMLSVTPEKRIKMGQKSFNLVQPYLSIHVSKELEKLYTSLLKDNHI